MTTGLICAECHQEAAALHIWRDERRALGRVCLCDNCATKRTPVEDEPDWLDLDFGDDEWERAFAAENHAALAADNERRTA